MRLTLILPVAEVAIITIIITIPTVAIAQEDRFGISELYPSATYGTEWYSTWNNGHDRTLEFGERDSYDDSFEVSGEGTVRIDGSTGEASISGNAPRMRVIDIDFENVEITFYAKRISENKEVSYQGFVAGARSKHYTDQECFADTYYGRMTYDGRISFEKELFHAHGDTAQFPPFEEPKYLWPKGSGIPPAEWIGFKFIVKTLPDEGSVLLELYLDLTDGKNGGEWEKILEYKDKGQWYAEAEDGICNDYPHNKILFAPGFVFIRNDFIEQADYKKFSIREIM